MRVPLKISRLVGLVTAMLFAASASSPCAQLHALSSRTSANEIHSHLLMLYNTHTGERINVVYRQGEQYIPRALSNRTLSTNEFLRARTTGVAKNSLHIQGQAIDLRMPGINTLTLRRVALALARGGVGYYPHSDFIHIDTGRVRQWCFNCSANLAAGEPKPRSQ